MKISELKQIIKEEIQKVFQAAVCLDLEITYQSKISMNQIRGTLKKNFYESLSSLFLPIFTTIIETGN